jgi:hypothetical protein
MGEKRNEYSVWWGTLKESDRSRDLLEKLVVVQLVVELPAVFGTHIFVTEFTRPHHWTLS